MTSSRWSRICLAGAGIICLLWAADVSQNLFSARSGRVAAAQTVVPSPSPSASPSALPRPGCHVTPVDPKTEGFMFIDVADARPDQPGYQRDLWFEFSPGCHGKLVTITSSAGERRSITVMHAGYEVLHDFTLISDPQFQAALANRSHEWLRINIEYEDLAPAR